jgi:hypothetical protein
MQTALCNAFMRRALARMGSSYAKKEDYDNAVKFCKSPFSHAATQLTHPAQSTRVWQNTGRQTS